MAGRVVAASSAAACILLLLALLRPGAVSDDSRYISYEDLLPTADVFSDPEASTFSQLLFDPARNQVVVGARDALYRLSLQRLSLLEKASWPAPSDKVSLCQVKGQSEASCHNYIKVLLTNGKRLFTCGTNAFSPQCSWRELENVNIVLELVKGVANCPYNPLTNITALLTKDGQYFIGSLTDFSGADPIIYRSVSANDQSALRTKQYDSKWLNDPQFVGSFERDNFVYFLFRETAVECINCGKIIYSRIARVCKNDSGGEVILKDNWTTFVKARLNCSIPGEYPFYFDEIQGMSYIPSVDIIYATFTTPSNSIPGSAICAFNMSAINAAFSGPFKHQASSGSMWEPHRTPHRHQECLAAPQSSQLLDSAKYQLMDHAVQSTTLRPLYIGQLETLTHIAVDVTSTILSSDHHVLYVATVTGVVKKILVLSRTHEMCGVEVWKLHSGKSPVPIHTLQYLKETESVYVGLEDSMLRIPVQHCDRHKSRAACLSAKDPYCGWNKLKEECTTAPNHNPLAKYWLQAVTQCPILTDTEIQLMGVQSSLDANNTSSVSVGVFLGSCLVAFFVGAIVATATWYFYQQRKRPCTSGSPHYISSKQNPYFTVPLKETATVPHMKRIPLFSCTSSSNSLPGSPQKNSANGGSIIPLGTHKLFAKPLSEYETATIKRNSHSLANGHMHTDLEQDKVSSEIE